MNNLFIYDYLPVSGLPNLTYNLKVYVNDELRIDEQDITYSHIPNVLLSVFETRIFDYDTVEVVITTDKYPDIVIPLIEDKSKVMYMFKTDNNINTFDKIPYKCIVYDIKGMRRFTSIFEDKQNILYIRDKKLIGKFIFEINRLSIYGWKVKDENMVENGTKVHGANVKLENGFLKLLTYVKDGIRYIPYLLKPINLNIDEGKIFTFTLRPSLDVSDDFIIITTDTVPITLHMHMNSLWLVLGNIIITISENLTNDFVMDENGFIHISLSINKDTVELFNCYGSVGKYKLPYTTNKVNEVILERQLLEEVSYDREFNDMLVEEITIHEAGIED